MEVIEIAEAIGQDEEADSRKPKTWRRHRCKRKREAGFGDGVDARERERWD